MSASGSPTIMKGGDVPSTALVQQVGNDDGKQCLTHPSLHLYTSKMEPGVAWYREMAVRHKGRRGHGTPRSLPQGSPLAGSATDVGHRVCCIEIMLPLHFLKVLAPGRYLVGLYLV